MKACLDEILIRGLDDWIQASEVASIAKEVGGAHSVTAMRELSLKLVRSLIAEGLVEVGMVYQGRGFIPWESSMEDSMERITREWSAKPNGPNLGEVCWLNLTAEGERVAQALSSG